MTLKVITIVGARPQFIKAAAVSRVIRDLYAGAISETLVHTGQHYDENMSKVFFDDLDIPTPGFNLEISGGSHGAMTGKMLEGIERILLAESPDVVLIYGDTNSTLAGALAAAKLHIPVAHVEAGLRSFNMRMPEEINRILSDRVSTLLFCPTQTAVDNLQREGITNGVHNVGDVMYDVALFYREAARNKSNIKSNLKLKDGGYTLATCHRAENTDDPIRLKEILKGLSIVAEEVPVVLPLHPRTQNIIHQTGLERFTAGLTLLPPLPFLDMVALEQTAKAIITDSGGIQKEAFFFNVPCITVRDETEWTETVQSGWNTLVGASSAKIVSAFADSSAAVGQKPKPYGNGNASHLIVDLLLNFSAEVA
jgi:UDP-GlcNAc3NAcA epimerase